MGAIINNIQMANFGQYFGGKLGQYRVKIRINVILISLCLLVKLTLNYDLQIMKMEKGS